MNLRKNLLAISTVAAVALMALAGTASATTLTSPAGTTYTGEIKASSGAMEFHGPFMTSRCQKSALAFKVEKHGAGVTAGGKLSSLTLGECNFPMTVLNPGSFEIHPAGGGHGTLTWTGGEITWESGFANCIYRSAGTDIGTFTGGTPAKLDIDSAAVPRTGHSFFCGSIMEWTGSYTFNTPGTLLVD